MRCINTEIMVNHSTLCWTSWLKILFTTSAFITLPGARLSFASFYHFIHLSRSVTGR